MNGKKLRRYLIENNLKRRKKGGMFGNGRRKLIGIAQRFHTKVKVWPKIRSSPPFGEAFRAFERLIVTNGVVKSFRDIKRTRQRNEREIRRIRRIQNKHQRKEATA